MKVARILIYACLIMTIAAPAIAEHSAIIVFNAPSSYIGLWETTPSMAILTVTAEIGTPATQARFFLRIEHESHGEIATGESGMRELRAGPGAQTFMSPEIVNWRELDYSSSRIDPVRASGRLPEGEYTAFVEIRDLHGELLAETRESFFIVYTDPPMLLNPLDDEEPAQPNPIFMWTPVILPAGHTVTYHLRIVEVLVGQPAERAMEVNSPFYEAEITGTEVHTYPAYEIPFERSIVYAWQIEAVDESGNPAARNDGKSAINTFYYGVPGEEITTELEITAIPSFFIISRMDQEVYVSLTLREPGIIHLIDPVEITHVRYSWMESGTTWRRMGTWEELETPISILPASSYRFTKTIVFNEELRTTLLRGATTGTFGLQIDFQSTETDGSVTHTAPFIVFEIVEIGSEFTVRVIYPERMPITLSPTSPRQTFRYEFDGMGHSEIHVTSHRIIAISPFDGTRSEHRTSPVDVTIPAGGTATMDDFVGYDVSYIIETILGERTMDRLGHSVTELDLPWDMIFTGMEGDREVIGRAEVIFRVQREASSTFDVRAESPDGMPLVWHPGAETHPLTFELDGTGHSEIEITGRQFYKYYPASDREIDRRPWPIGSVRIPPGGTIRVDEGFELSADAQEALLHDPELTTALGDDSPLQVELQYRIVFEGIEHPEGSAEEFPVTGEVIIPALIREAREGEESLTVPVSLTSGVETPLIFHPEATEHGIELQVDGTGLGLLEMTSSNRTIHIPASSAIFSVDPVSHSGIAIAENTIGILPLDIVIDADRQAEILRRAAGGAHEVMGEYEIDVICDEVTSERRQVRHGRISIPILIRSSVINPSFDVRANSPDGIPLVWHPGQETNRIQFILDGTGHNEIELTGSNTFMGIPVIDSDTQVGHWPPLEGLGFHIPAGRPFTITSGIAMTMEQQQQRLNDPDLAAVSEGPVDELEIYYRFEFEGLETMEGGGERVPVFGQVTVPMIIHREVEGESPETFPLRLAEGADLPLVFHPGAVSFTVNLELDATGLGAMSYYSAESGVFIPASSGFFWADIDPPEISVEENTVLTYPWELAISPERQREILSSAFSVGGADRGFEDLEGEYLVTIVVMEGGTTIRRGTVNIPIIIRSAEAEAMASIDLTVTSSLSELVYAAGEEEKNLDFRLTSGLTQEVEMDTIIFSMERDGREVLNTIHEISLTVPAGGTADIEEHALAIDRGRILGTESTVEGELTVTFRGARTGGERVFTRMTIPMRVTIESEGRPATTGDAYVLVRNTAILMPTTETTIIRGDDGHITLNGRGRLVILPSPFDSTEVDVSLSALTLEPHDDNPDSMVVTGGRLDAFSEGEENLFTLYASLFQAKRISFDAVRDRDELLKIDLAHVNLPGEEPLILTNVIVNEHGISLEDVDLEYSMFGLTLRITDIRTGGGAGSSSLRLTVHMRLQGRTRSEEFASTEITITESGGIEGRVEPEPEPYAIIPGDGDRAILAISAIEFKVHPDSVESYVGLTVALNYPSPLEELGPSEFTLKIGSEGTITGEVALITEGEDDDLETDITKVDFGSFATFDLTYLAVQLQGSGDGFDEAHSFVAISGNFIFRRSESETYTIHFGDNEDEPGVRINFDGSVEWHDLMLATDQRINMGPVYIRLRTLGFEFSPEFKFILAGGLGVDKEDVFSGEILLETLKVDKNGNVDFDHIGIMGGSLSIMDMVGISVRDFDYCSSGDCSISFKAASGKTAKDTSITVESFFQIQGAEITIGEDGAAGSGGFEELLVFEDEGENNFVLRQAELNIAEQVEIKLDLRYLQGHPVWGDVLSLAGNVRIPKQPDPITASVYGKIGEKPDGSSTWGLFVSAGGLGIQMGPVTLDAVGGGFFYNPIIEDLAAVRDLCGIERPDISGKIEGIDRPEGAGYPGSFAAMLYAGLYVGSRDVVEGRALLAITERNVTLDAEITALDKKAQGAFYLAVGWDPNYLEGMFELEVNLYSIIGADADLMFYVYGEDLWSVMGESEIQLFPSHPIITVGADFFIGPPGFLLDMNFDLGFDIGILSAEARFETMYWYNSGVSWGAYILISAEGEILWGLAGVAGSLEGALIGTPEEGTLVYCVGSFYAELCWVTVFDGSVWMTLSGDGFDGGEGRNSKYDQLIEDARNMADQMRSDMDDMAEAMGSTGILSDEQLEAAGLALIQGLGSTSSVGLLRQYQNDADQYSALVPSDARNSLLGIKTDIFQHENIRQNVATLQSMEANKRTLSAYSEFLSSRHSAVTAEMRGMGDLLSADLPALSDLPALTNPVGAARYETINIDGRSITIKVDVEFNEETAAEITDQVSRQQRDIEEYQQTLFQLIGEYERNLTALDEFMGPSEEPADSPGGPGGAGDISPNELSQWYGRLFSAMNGYYETYLGLIYNGPQQMAALAAELESRQAVIVSALQSQAGALNAEQARTLAGARLEFISQLLELADLPSGAVAEWPSPEAGDTEGWRTQCVERGNYLWYEIPERGILAYGASLASRKPAVVELAHTSRSAFLGDWVTYTNGLQNVHDRRARLHELLYDLFDQLSQTATRYPAPDVIMELAPATTPLGGAARGGETDPFMTTVTPFTPARSGAEPGASVVTATGTHMEDLYERSPRGFFARKRDQMTRTLTPPRINTFSGDAASSNPYFAHVSMSWDAIHPIGITDISYRLVNPGRRGTFSGVDRGFATELPWRTVGPWAENTFFTAIDSLDPAGSYQVYLRVTGAGGSSVTRQGLVPVAYAEGSGSPFSSSLSSDDDTPPTTPVVDDSVDYTQHTDQLYASWRATDPQSGIEQYQYRIVTHRAAVGRSKDGGSTTIPSSVFTPVTEWSSAVAMQSRNIRELELAHNYTYYVEVKAQNGVGLWSTVGRSDGVLVDTTSATRPTINSFILGEYPSVDAGGMGVLGLSGDDAATTPATITTGSGVVIGMGGMPPTETDNPAASTAIPPALVTTVPGLPGGENGPYPNTLSARWSQAEDAESGVIGYYYAIGSSPDAADILGWTFTEWRQITVHDLPIFQGDSCYFRVRAVNSAGKLGPIASRRLIVEYEDSTPPRHVPYVIASYNMETDSLVVYWYGDGGDPESGITEYQWAIGRNTDDGETSTLVSPWTSTGQQSRVETVVALASGRTFYIKVRAINGIGLYRMGYRQLDIPWRTMTVIGVEP